MLNTPFSPWPSFSEEEANAVRDVILSNKVNYWTGQECREFEKEFAAWAGSDYAIALANGTVALELGIAAMDLPAGSRIAVPSLTFPATAHAVQRCGHHPVLCDVDEDHWLLTPEIARGVDCDAALPVSTYGMVQPADAWDAFTADTGRPVLLDAASALGWQAVGARTCVTFSLHATKPFGCTGDNGIIFFHTKELLMMNILLQD